MESISDHIEIIDDDAAEFAKLVGKLTKAETNNNCERHISYRKLTDQDAEGFLQRVGVPHPVHERDGLPP